MVHFGACLPVYTVNCTGHAKNNSNEDKKKALNSPLTYIFILKKYYKGLNISLFSSLVMFPVMSNIQFSCLIGDFSRCEFSTFLYFYISTFAIITSSGQSPCASPSHKHSVLSKHCDTVRALLCIWFCCSRLYLYTSLQTIADKRNVFKTCLDVT